jgi:UDP-glucose 4-epimerase
MTAATEAAATLKIEAPAGRKTGMATSNLLRKHSSMKILVTGGMGYIGSHTVVELQNAGHEVVVLDNLSNANRSVQERVTRITGKAFEFIEADIRDRAAMEAAFGAHKVDAVIHFAGLKAVGESVAQPLRYYDNNVSGSVVLFETMAKFGCKMMIEDILRDLIKAEPDWHIALLRYFNPVGAHESGLIGEEPNGIPNNLVPYIAQVANGQREKLSVFGGDYPTPDGTGMRDYIHVVDLSIGHVKTLDKLVQGPGLHTYNLGTGNGNSVLEMIHAFEKASGKPIPYQIVDRRPGDIAKCYADPARARDELGWTAQRDIAQMCADSWRYQTTPK